MDPIPTDVLNAIPSKWLVYFNAAVAVYWIADHVVQVLAKNNGLVGLWRKIIYGSPDSKRTEQIEAHLENTDRIVTKDLKQ
jgi:hypothetical protein